MSVARTAGIVCMCVFAAASASAQVKGDVEGLGHVKGSADAPIEIIEFADFACTFCGQFARETMPAIEREWIETGRAKFRFLPFDLSYFKPGRHAARAAECAAEQDAFWPMHDVLYERQEDWLGRGGQKEKFHDWAGELGLDLPRYDDCYDRDPGKKNIERNTKLSRENRVRATPTFFVNGKRVEGALSLKDFTSLLEAAAAGEATTNPAANGALMLADGPDAPCGESSCSAASDPAGAPSVPAVAAGTTHSFAGHRAWRHVPARTLMPSSRLLDTPDRPPRRFSAH